MEIDRVAFQPMLPRILEAIADAHFVALDLELSGIAKQPYKQAVSNAERRGKQTLQERYTETKEAAEKYQVLQVGLTCVEWDADGEVYIARPFNFNVNPLIKERIDIERDITFQSGAVEFLLAHKFRLQAPFIEGVPYLSRYDEKLARKRAFERQDKWAVTDIDLREDDVQGREFVETTRAAIEKWISRRTPAPDYLNVGPYHVMGEPQDNRGLNNFQKRLVHQLIRAEFPDLVSISRPGFVQIVEHDERREDSLRQSKQKRLEEQLSRQIGLRWLIEAMIGGDLSGVDEKNFARSNTGEPIFVDMEELKSTFGALRERLGSRQTVLVGHNMFTDVISLYHTFVGPLPESVTDFQCILHQLFPMIIDTKWLFTFQSDRDTQKSSLQEIEQSLRKQFTPSIEMPLTHHKYLMSECAHEAGYDSWLTAKVLVKLAAKLSAEGMVRMPPTEDDSTEPEQAPDGGVRVSASSREVTLNLTSTAEDLLDNRSPGSPPAASRSGGYSTLGQPQTHSLGTTFASAGRFDSLLDLPADEDLSSSEVVSDFNRNMTIQHRPGSPKRLPKKSSNQIPPFDDVFWAFFGNKLRVFGTEEGVCDLTAELEKD